MANSDEAIIPEGFELEIPEGYELETMPVTPEGFVVDTLPSDPPEVKEGKIAQLFDATLNDIGQTVVEDIPQAGRAIANVAYQGVLRSLDEDDPAGRMARAVPGLGSAAGAVVGVGEEVWKRAGGTLPEKAEKVLRFTGRGAMQLAGGLVAGPLFPVGMAAGGRLWDDIMQGLGLDPKTTPEQDLRQLRKEVILSGLPLAVGKGLKIAGQLPSDARYFASIPKTSKMQAAKARMPDALAAALRPPGNTAIANGIAEDLERATRTFVSQSKALLRGVDQTAWKPKNVAANPLEANKQFDKFQNNVSQKIVELSHSKQSVLQQLEARALTTDSKLGRLELTDLKLDKLRDLIRQRNLSAITKENAAQLEGLLKDLESDFFSHSSIIDPRTGKPFVEAKTLSLTEADEVLGNIYNRLEEARAFDAKIAQGAITTPSAMAANEVLYKGLKEAANVLRNRISGAADEVIEAFPILKGQGYHPGLIKKVNGIISDLIPIRDATRLFTLESQVARRVPAAKQGDVRSLLSEVTRPIVDPIRDARMDMSALGRNPALGRELADIGQNWGTPAPSPLNLNPLEAVPGGPQVTGAAATSMYEMERRRIDLERVSTRYKMDLTQFPSASVDSEGKVVIDDPNDQQGYLRQLRQDKKVPLAHIAEQASLFHSPSSNNEVLVPRAKKTVPTKEKIGALVYEKGTNEEPGEAAY